MQTEKHSIYSADDRVIGYAVARSDSCEFDVYDVRNTYLHRVVRIGDAVAFLRRWHKRRKNLH